MDKTKRRLVCLATGSAFDDDGLRNEEEGVASLLRAEYAEEQFVVKQDAPGLYRYANWLPIDRYLSGSGTPVSFYTEGLAARLKIKRLVVTFSGYWPERGAFMRTGSFKECEAYSVCARFPYGAGSGNRLVIASAGNTARAFYRAANENNVPLLIVIPEKNLGKLIAVSEAQGGARVVAVGGGGDYFDAITLANKICSRPGFINEGGAKNAARRDGMGTTVLSAAEFTGEIPDVYVQAVGSGTGAIAAHEANLRLNAGGLAPKIMKIAVVQNAPFTPMTDVWVTRSRELAPMDIGEAKRRIAEIDAATLSNRMPPYGITGGLYDALAASDGLAGAVTNAELRAAAALFEETEGCDICAEAGAALAYLIKLANDGVIGDNELVMINVTGGGLKRIQRDFAPRAVQPDYVMTPEEMADDKNIDALCEKLR